MKKVYNEYSVKYTVWIDGEIKEIIENGKKKEIRRIEKETGGKVVKCEVEKTKKNIELQTKVYYTIDWKIIETFALPGTKGINEIKKMIENKEISNAFWNYRELKKDNILKCEIENME